MIKFDYIKYFKKENSYSDFAELYLHELKDRGKEKILSERENKFMELSEKEIEINFEIDKKTNTEKVDLKNLFRGYNYQKIIKLQQNEIIYFIKTIENNLNEKKYGEKIVSTIKKYLLENVFDYDALQSKRITPFFKKHFDFKTCFYCNQNFISNFEIEGKLDTKSTFQLDHFYDKATYPYLALSFYNLIPCCATCNSPVVKGSADFFKVEKEVIAPNNENFKFHEKVKFKTFLLNKGLQFNNEEDIDLLLVENFSNEYSKYSEVFQLENRYKAHKNLVIEMLNKRKKYPDSRIQELADLTRQTFGQVKQDLFGEYLFEDDFDLSKKPLSKLTHDIAEELGLI
jgi:hypothetical protein